MSKIPEEEMERTVLVGSKPVGNYVGACLTQLQTFDEIYVRARGRECIGTAVVVSELMRDKYDKDTSISTRTDINPDNGEPVAAVKITVSDAGLADG